MMSEVWCKIPTMAQGPVTFCLCWSWCINMVTVERGMIASTDPLPLRNKTCDRSDPVSHLG